MPYSINGDRYRLECSLCSTHIDTRIGKGRTAVSNAVYRVRKQAEQDGWNFDHGDRCGRHRKETS